MSEFDVALTLPPDQEEPQVGKAAVLRYYQSLGKGVDTLQLMMASISQVGYHAHNYQVRFPTKPNQGFLTIVKAYHEEGPVIAFHNTYQLVDALLGIGSRHLAGQMEWQQDAYPKENWVDEMAFLHKQTRYLE